LLVRRLAGDVRIPARSTVHAVLDRHGLVKRGRQRQRHKAQGTPLSAGSETTSSGVPTTRANSSSATANTVTP
jgi:hypothetical protein